MQKLTKLLLFATGALCFSVNANEFLTAQKAIDETDYQLIFLLNEEAYGVDVADQTVLAVSPQAARSGITNQLS